jgi:hypothetical protein
MENKNDAVLPTARKSIKPTVGWRQQRLESIHLLFFADLETSDCQTSCSYIVLEFDDANYALCSDESMRQLTQHIIIIST